MQSVWNSARRDVEEGSVKYLKEQLWIWQNELPEWRVQFAFRVAPLLTLRGTGRGFGLILERRPRGRCFFFFFFSLKIAVFVDLECYLLFQRVPFVSRCKMRLWTPS